MGGMAKNMHSEKIPPPATASQPRSRVFQIVPARFLLKCGIALSIFCLYRLPITQQSLPGQGVFSNLHGIHSKIQASVKQNVEELFLSIPSPESALAASREYATHPHIAGADEDLQDAKDILALFQTELGIAESVDDSPIFPAGTLESRNATLSITSTLTAPAAWIDIYYPVMNTAKQENLELHILGEDGETIWTANLEEDGDEGDPDAAKYRTAIPSFHGLSGAGEAEGQLIYANYGTKEDYDQLVAAGVDLKGKIVLTRYGRIFRGLKVKGAEDLGAAGVLIYSDPRDDGGVTVEKGFDAYPAGPARNPTSIQRGSVMYLPMYPGDPTTPGYPAYSNASRTDGENIPKIPSLPLSWQNAQRLLGDLDGLERGRELNGKVSENTVRIVNNVDTKVIPIWNTMAAIPGHVKDEVVVLGCHRDAWVMGAADPTSGTVSFHEVVRGLGALLKSGWKPLRTIVLASWDAEEYGLIGSTEWGEDFADWIQSHVVSYINVDVSVSGSRWGASGSPSLAHLIKRAAMDVPHPYTPGKSLWDASNDAGPFVGSVGGLDSNFAPHITLEEQSQEDAVATGIDRLGSGSDYTVFLQRLGVASSDQGFGGSGTDAVYHYHSIYDSQRWQELYADPGFRRHVAVANCLGLLAVRIADAIILPLNTTQYALELDKYLDEVEEAALVSGVTPDVTELRKAIDDVQSASIKLDKEKIAAEKAFRKLLDRLEKIGHYRAVFRQIIKWIKKHLGLEKRYAEDRQAADFNHWVYLSGSVANEDEKLPDLGNFPLRKFIAAAKRIQKVNKKLTAFERGFISEGGIKDREWYKHLVVAPGKYLGYGATVLPALTEAVVYDKNITLAQGEVTRLSRLLKKLAAELVV